MESAAEVDFHSEGSLMLSSQANAHSQWRVVSAKFSKQKQIGITINDTYPVLIFDYIIERHSSFHLAALLTPILSTYHREVRLPMEPINVILFLVMVFLNLFLTWLSTDSVERKLLLAVSIFCHFQFMMQLHWAVPYNGETVPGICIHLLIRTCSAFAEAFSVISVIFFRNSLIITSLLIIHSMIGTAVKHMDRKPPAIVMLLAGTIAKNKFGELVFAGDYMNVEYKV